MVFNKKLFFFIIFTFTAVTGSAQELVYPNRPGEMLNSNRGLVTIIEFHAGTGAGKTSVPYSKRYTGFTALIGYQINKNFIIAAGTGLSVYNGGSMTPVFIEFIYTFSNSRIVPYLYADGGLLMNFKEVKNTKVFLNPGIGAKYAISRKVALNIATGILVQAGGSSMEIFINLTTGLAYKF